MTLQRMIVFLAIVLAIYGGGSLYVHRRIATALPPGGWSLLFSLAFLALTLCYPMARILERSMRGTLTETLVVAGSFWMGALVYLLLGVLAYDLLRLVGLIPGLPHWLSPASLSAAWRGWGAPLLLAATALVVAMGWLNARHPRLNVRTLDVQGHAAAGAPAEMRVALVTDIHLGHLAGEAHLRRMNALLKDFNPDVVLLGGDVVDEDLQAVIDQDLGGLLEAIPSRWGVVACLGNHEYFGGVAAASTWMAGHKIALLRDARLVLPNGVAVLGRDDRNGARFTSQGRKTVAELAAGLPAEQAKIVLDHQPAPAAEFADAGVDLVLSGHTHDGQLWPFGGITRLVFEHSVGLRRVGRAWQYVSPGFGTWGPPMRTGNRPEVAGFVLRFAH